MKESSDTGVTAVKIYFPEQDPIRVHQSRVSHCPEGFPPGWFWYGDRRSGPERPPRWIEQVLRALRPETATRSDSCAGRQEISCLESSTGESEESHEMTGDMSIQFPRGKYHNYFQSQRLAVKVTMQDSGVQLTGDPSDIEPNMGRARARSRTDFSGVGLSKTRTRNVKPPDRLMTVRSGRALLRPRGM